MNLNKLTISITEAGSQAGIGRTVAYRLAAAGIIPTVLIPGTSMRRVPVARFREWLEETGILPRTQAKEAVRK